MNERTKQSAGLFVFGTLMDPDVLQLVIGESLDSLLIEPARVDGYARLWVLDDLYPVLVQRPGQRTEGQIIRGLSDAAMDRIAFYEGEEFCMQRMQVIAGHGLPEEVDFFAWNHRQALSELPWSLDAWQQDSKHETLPRVERFMSLYGVMSLSEANELW